MVAPRTTRIAIKIATTIARSGARLLPEITVPKRISPRNKSQPAEASVAEEAPLLRPMSHPGDRQHHQTRGGAERQPTSPASPIDRRAIGHRVRLPCRHLPVNGSYRMLSPDSGHAPFHHLTPFRPSVAAPTFRKPTGSFPRQSCRAAVAQRRTFAGAIHSKATAPIFAVPCPAAPGRAASGGQALGTERTHVQVPLPPVYARQSPNARRFLWMDRKKRA